MKIVGIWVSLFLFGTALLVLSFSVSEGMAFPQDSDGMTAAIGRKLKKNSYDTSNEKGSNVDLEDYHPINPVPSSKASIKPGPIQHGSPLIPYIPGKPSPPGHPKTGGST
ncbi:hypothetical protein SLA2020_376400 [Shorea laevis]